MNAQISIIKAVEKASFGEEKRARIWVRFIFSRFRFKAVDASVCWVVPGASHARRSSIVTKSQVSELRG